MLPRSSFLLSYTPLDGSISPGIISSTYVIIFKNCLLRPCYEKKIIFYFHYLPGGSFYPVPHLALSHLNLLLGFLVQPGGHERRSWSQNRTGTTTHSVDTYERADCREFLQLRRERGTTHFRWFLSGWAQLCPTSALLPPPALKAQTVYALSEKRWISPLPAVEHIRQAKAGGEGWDVAPTQGLLHHEGAAAEEEELCEFQPHCPAAKPNLLPLLSLLVPHSWADPAVAPGWGKQGWVTLAGPWLEQHLIEYNDMLHSHCWTPAGWSRLNKSSNEAMEQLSLAETIVNFLISPK